MKINRNNTDPAYWEKVLAAHRLKPHEAEASESHETISSSGRRSTMNDRDYEDLRKFIDGDDTFMRGHQVVKVRTHDRETPSWAASNKAIRELVERSFPKMSTSKTQKTYAVRWLRIIQLFYRMGLSQSYIALEMNISRDVVKDTLRSIQRASRGVRANNTSARTTVPPSGQPT
jgi:hypothetical protein